MNAIVTVDAETKIESAIEGYLICDMFEKLRAIRSRHCQ